MPNFDDLSGLDALAAAVAARLAGTPLGPSGEPGLRMPAGLPPRSQLAHPLAGIRAGASVAIGGIEFIQSTQHNGTSGVSYGADNAVPLVAYKTMVARVYPFVRRGILGDDPLTGQRVTGQLTLSIGNRVVYQTGPTRVEGARLGSTSRIDRGLWDTELTLPGGRGASVVAQQMVLINCSLNFVVPAYYCRVGRMYASVHLWPVADGAMSARSASATEYIFFVDVPAPKVCLVRVNWVDGAGNVTRPSDASMLNTLGVATRMLPFPYFQTTILGAEVTSSGAYAMLAPVVGGCNIAWDKLVADLNVTRIFTSLFQLGDIVYGMVPQVAIPAGTTKLNSGCGRGAGGGFVGYDTTVAHEFGHLYDSDHVGIPGDPNNDPDYPNYGGSLTSIGEVGIDTGTSPPTLFEPSDCGDIMSYRNKQWISPYTYQRILDHRDMHQAAAVVPGRLRPVLFLEFRMYRASASLSGSRIEIRKAVRLDAAGIVPPAPASAPSPVSVDMLDGNFRVLATHHCRWVPAHGHGRCGCGCGGKSGTVPLDREPWLDFQEVLEWPDEGIASIAFHQGADAFHAISVGEPPQVAIEGPERRETQLVVRVTATHPREQPSIAVLFSADDGTTWEPLAFDPPNNEVIVESDRLAGGPRCLFRAIATAELQSATADTEPFELPRTGRKLYLDVPSGDCGVAPGPVAVAAHVDTRGLGAVAPSDIRWSSDLDGELGTGYSLTVDLSEGRHELTATASDGLGGRLSERAIIIVGGRHR